MIKYIDDTVAYLNQRGFLNPEVGIILGTGLGQLLNEVKIEHEVSYNQIPHFPTATVEFHKGKLIYGDFEGKKVVVMQGRFHLYEGYDLIDVTFPVRVMNRLGIQNLLVSNAAGAINLDFKKGDLMLIEDHINLLGGSPLAYKGASKSGNIFVDMSNPYDKSMKNQLIEISKTEGVKLHQGVYVSVLGPQLETPAEYRYLKIIGADAVGMSTVPEVIVANQLKIPVIAVSVLTDECDPDHLQPVNVEDIIKIAKEAEPKMVKLFSKLLKRI